MKIGQLAPLGVVRVDVGAHLEEAGRVGVTAGASTPEHLVTEVVEELRRKHGSNVQEVHVVEEDVRFGLPRELEDIARAAGKTLPPRGGAMTVS